jgi:hypothetical protein
VRTVVDRTQAAGRTAVDHMVQLVGEERRRQQGAHRMGSVLVLARRRHPEVEHTGSVVEVARRRRPGVHRTLAVPCKGGIRRESVSAECQVKHQSVEWSYMENNEGGSGLETHGYCAGAWYPGTCC